jgi:hypothetical protein
MNNKEFNKVNWINIIIFKNFQDYFNLKELQCLSMLSKFTRLKLNQILFNSIKLIKIRNRNYNSEGKLIMTFNVQSFESLNSIVVNDEDEIDKSPYIKKFISDIDSELQGIKYFVKSIFISSPWQSGYCLYPMLTSLVNLSELKIHCSIIQYSIFQKLGEYFPMLKTFKLYRITLLKNTTDKDNLNEIIFPANLSYLSIRFVEIGYINIAAEPYNIVFSDYGDFPQSKFSLPNIYLPSLKNLEFIRCSTEENGLEEFLQINPSLEQLKIDAFNLETSKYFNSLKSLHVENLEDANNLESLATCKNIKILKICIEYGNHYDKFEKICLMCPLVEFLHFDVIYHENPQEAVNTYLVPILKKLPNLKTIELLLNEYNDDYYDELIDINTNSLSTIEKIIFVKGCIVDLEVRFEKHHSLKEVEFRNIYFDINKEKFLERYKSYSNWEFKFFKRKVKGYKISNNR